MLTELYIKAQLDDDELADQVWGLWNQGLISDDLAVMAWCILATSDRHQGKLRCHAVLIGESLPLGWVP